MNVLVIFEMIPEETHLYIIKNPKPVLLGALKKAHKSYINHSGNIGAVNEVHDFIEENKIERMKIVRGKPLEVDVHMIVHTGWVI